LRAGLAFIWLATGLLVLHPEYRRLGAYYLEPLGMRPWVMVVTCIAEVLLGLRVLLGRAATWLVALQLAMIAAFTAILSITQPQFLLDTNGRLTKNVPLIAMLVVLWLVEREGWTPRAIWVLRLGMASVWFAEGLIHKMLFGIATPLTGAVLGSKLLRLEVNHTNVAIVGALEVVAAVMSCIPRGWMPRLALLGLRIVLISVTIFASVTDPLLWVDPFGPLTKNIPWLLGMMVVWGLAQPVSDSEAAPKTR
jgi:uncharacterized membrane protein YphA (DoxX/SURF4 family)